MPSWLILPSILDVVDILLVAAAGFLAISTLRRTRARNALIGLAVVTLVYVIARGFDLRLTATLLQAFFAVAVLVLVVVFQEDLRRFFDGLGAWRPGREPEPVTDHGALVRAVVHLANKRTGALIVIPGLEALERHITGGIELNGRLSEPLLLSIFDASSPGHDGAALIRGGVVERFAVHLPLSSNRESLGATGTRHAAALGLAECSDAIVIAVSEERGTVSVARNGRLEVLDRATDLVGILRGLNLQDVRVEEPLFQRRGFRDAAIALAGAFVLWLVLIPGSEVVETDIEAPIVLSNLPTDLDLESIDPATVRVVLRGPRRDVIIAERNRVSIQLDAYLARFGRRTFTISADTVEMPNGLTVVSIHPEKVRLSLESLDSTESPASRPESPTSASQSAPTAP